MTVVPELLATGAKVNVAALVVPPKTFEKVKVVPEMAVIYEPAGKVTVPIVITAIMPIVMLFIDPVIVAEAFEPFTVRDDAVIPAITAGMIHAFVTSVTVVIATVVAVCVKP